MKFKNIEITFLSLASLFLVCTSSAFAEEQVQHQTGVIDTIKNSWDKLRFYEDILLSKVSYEINKPNVSSDGSNVTTQEDLNFWNDSQARYPLSENPVFINMYSVCRPAYDHIPEGTTRVTVTDNSGNSLNSYSVTKNKTGFTIQRGSLSNPDHSYKITLNKLEELNEIYGNVRQVKACEMYIKEQINEQSKNQEDK